MTQVLLPELVAAAQSGDRLISFPTDTVPALAARPDRAEMIYAAKQRDRSKPLILMAADLEDLWGYVQGSESEKETWRNIAAQYWPGALTLVLPASDRLPRAVNPTDPTTIGIRIPDRSIARQILRLTGALATTSVNRSGQPALTSIAAINAQFPEVLTLSLEAIAALEGQTHTENTESTEDAEDAEDAIDPSPASGVPSTVIKWTKNGWEVLRQGSVVIKGRDR